MWLKLDDRFHGHVKVRRAGNAGVGLWVRCANYAGDYGTDGKIPLDIAEDYGKPAEIRAVTASGLWVPTDDGFVIPDFLEFNPSAAEVAASRARTHDARRIAGLARAASAKRDEAGHFIPDQNGEPW